MILKHRHGTNLLAKSLYSSACKGPFWDIFLYCRQMLNAIYVGEKPQYCTHFGRHLHFCVDQFGRNLKDG